MARTLLGVVAGYLVFAGSAVALFAVTGIDPHATPRPIVALGGTAYGVAFAILAGYVATSVAGRSDLRAPIVLACVIALGALVSLLARPGGGAIWSQLATLVLMAPAVVAGGGLARRRA